MKVYFRFGYPLGSHLDTWRRCGAASVILTDRLLSFYFFILRVIYSICYGCLKTNFSDRCSADQVMVILAVGFTTYKYESVF
jgi:hypothetical protein